MVTGSKKNVKEIRSLSELQYEFGRATIIFGGNETEANWELRTDFLTKVTTFLLSDMATKSEAEIVKELHLNISSIVRAIHSNRSTLANGALSFIDAIASSVALLIPMYDLEIILSNLLKISVTSKKTLATKIFVVTNHLLSKIKFHTRVITMLCNTSSEKNPQLREYAAFFIATVFEAHGENEEIRARLAKPDLNKHINTFIQKGLFDATPTVREACKKTYKVYEMYWPTEAADLLQTLDPAIARRLNGQPPARSPTPSTRSPTPVRKSPKPTLHRTLKSSSSISKPKSSTRNPVNSPFRNAVNKATVEPSSTVRRTPKPGDPSGKIDNTNQASSTQKPAISTTSASANPLSKTAAKPAFRRTVKSAGSIAKPTSNITSTAGIKRTLKILSMKPNRSTEAPSCIPRAGSTQEPVSCSSATIAKPASRIVYKPAIPRTKPYSSTPKPLSKTTISTESNAENTNHFTEASITDVTAVNPVSRTPSYPTTRYPSSVNRSFSGNTQKPVNNSTIRSTTTHHNTKTNGDPKKYKQ